MKFPLFKAALFFVLGLFTSLAVHGQSFSIVRSFSNGTNGLDGVTPSCTPVLGTDGNYYGVTSAGGSSGIGTVYRMTPWGQTNFLYSFGSVSNDGASPVGLLQATDGTFYGITKAGGTSSKGTVFKMTVTTGSSPVATVTQLYSFSGADGDTPVAGLTEVPSGPNSGFYGTTQKGGASNLGTVFKVSSSGSLSTIHSFTGVGGNGATPMASLMFSGDGNLYGTTQYGGTLPPAGGTLGQGTVFKCDLSSTPTVSVIYQFNDTSSHNDGMHPVSGLVQGANGYLYGTTMEGGFANNFLYSSPTGNGTIFKVSRTGQNEAVLYNFTDNSLPYTGFCPITGLTLGSDGYFYGTTKSDTSFSNSGYTYNGTIYRMTPQGTVTFLRRFMDGSITNDARGDYNLGTTLAITADGNLCGVSAKGGGTNDFGTFFKLDLTLPGLTSNPGIQGYSGSPIGYQTLATNRPSSFAASSLPPGVTLNSTTGWISGTPSVVGNYVSQLSMTNAAGTSVVNLKFTIIAPPPILTSPSYAFLANGSSFNFTLSATNNPSNFDIPSGLPSWLSYNASTFTLSGTPPAGEQSRMLTIRPNNGVYALDQTLTLNISTPTNFSIISRDYVSFNSAGPLIQGFDGRLYFAGSSGNGGISSLPTTGNITILGFFASQYWTRNGPGNGPLGVIQASDGNFYGTTCYGGITSNIYDAGSSGIFNTYGLGTLYKITPDGTISILHNFGDGSVPNDGKFGDGGQGTSPYQYTAPLKCPDSCLMQATDGNFYGVTPYGGAYGKGTVFKLTPSGQYSVLYSFKGVPPQPEFGGINLPDAANPISALVQVGDFLYGVTKYGGDYALPAQNGNPAYIGGGALYKIDFSGNLTVLHSFYGNGTTTPPPPLGILPADGIQPECSLTLGQDGYLYGVSQSSGANGSGCIFYYGLANHVYGVFYDFPPKVGSVAQGYPSSVVQGFDGYFYVTAQSGGANGYGYILQYKSAPYGYIGIPHDCIYPDLGDGKLQSIFQAADGNFYGGTAGNGGNGGGLYKLGGGGQVPGFAPSVTGPSSVTMAVNTIGTYRLLVGGSATSWSAVNLPAGLSIDATTGVVSGFPTTPGVYTRPITATNAAGSVTQNVTFTIVDAPTITSATTLTLNTLNANFTYLITATGSPTRFSGTNLPDWITVNPNNGVITGTPPNEGVTTIVIGATNAVGTGVATLTINVIKVSQTISFPALGTQVYGTTFAPTVSATSGLPVTLSVVSGPATVAGGNVTITSGVGTVTLQASQPGNDTYRAANSVNTSFAVSKAPQTITFPSLVNQPAGTATLSLSATSSSGLGVSYSVLSGPATVSGHTLTFTGQGTVMVQAMQAGSSQYLAASNVSQSVIMGQIAQAINAFSTIPTQTFGAAPFTITVPTATSGLPVSVTVLSGPATIAGNTLTLTGPGTVVLVGNQSGGTNYYAASQVTTSFTVNPGSQTITFPAVATQQYGTPLALGATASSGLAVTYSVVSGPATVSGNTVTFTGVGSVTLQASQAGNANYTAATAVQQSFSVTKADQTITFGPLANQSASSSPITLTATASSGLAITYSVSGVATVSGNVLTITGVGRINVTARQSGNSLYNAASQVTQSFNATSP